MHYIPVTLPFLFFLIILFIFLIILIEVRVLSYAYQVMGISRRYVFLLLFVSLMGTYFNVPVYQFPDEKVMSGVHIDFFGMRYIIPKVREQQGSTVAVNIGGAVIPFLLSLYLLVKNKFYGKALAGIVLVTIVAHMLAYTVKGLGIAEPLFVPPDCGRRRTDFGRKVSPGACLYFRDYGNTHRCGPVKFGQGERTRSPDSFDRRCGNIRWNIPDWNRSGSYGVPPYARA